MKRPWLLFFLAVCVVSCLCPSRTRISTAAEYSYARVVTSDAVLYADPALSMPRFTLPESYYVKIITAEADYCRVSYMEDTAPQKEGYVKTVSLMFVSKKPSNPYPTLLLSLSRDEVVFSDLDDLTPRAVLSKGDEASFYGERKFGGEDYVYVYCSGYVGYVKKNGFTPFSVPLLPDYKLEEQPSSSSSSSSSERDNDEASSDPGKLVVIAAALIAVVCVIFIITRPQKKTSEAFYRDDE